MSEYETHTGECEYCERPGTVTNFPFLSVNACADCVRMYGVVAYEVAATEGRITLTADGTPVITG